MIAGLCASAGMSLAPDHHDEFGSDAFQRS
jgi:hypothetical protein